MSFFFLHVESLYYKKFQPIRQMLNLYSLYLLFKYIFLNLLFVFYTTICTMQLQIIPTFANNNETPLEIDSNEKRITSLKSYAY